MVRRREFAAREQPAKITDERTTDVLKYNAFL